MRRLLAGLAALLCAAACAPTGAGSATVGPRSQPANSAATTRIGHIFVIVLENESYRSAYTHNPNPYLGNRLQRQGTLLTHYYGIGHYSLDNYLAMISGQAPNPATSADCTRRTRFKPSGHKLRINKQGQAVGKGCVFPARVKTLADQLDAHHVSWGGYMDDLGAQPGREQARCGVPHLTKGRYDGTQGATKKDQYAARHNPFVYFHSLLDSGSCKSHVVNLNRLTGDLASARTTPAFSFITPDLCDDGHDATCAGKNLAGTHKGGLVAVDYFLKKWVPIIEASPAFRQNGLLIITSDEGTDATSCCNEKPGPTQTKPGQTGPGGGRVGSLVIGQCVTADAKDPTPYNHYSLLRSLEDLLDIGTGGTDGNGHLGYAAAPGLRPFGHDLFNDCGA